MASWAATPEVPGRKFACAICGRKDTADRMVFSTFTRRHFCGPGFCKGDRKETQ